MRLGDILEDIKVRMPHAFEESQLVCWLNGALGEVYKVLAIRDGLRITASGQMLYPLPGDVSCDLISAVVREGKELEARRIGDAAYGEIWFKVSDDFIGLYPAPKCGENIMIWYFQRPDRILTAQEAAEEGISYENQSIRLDPDYGEMLKTALCIMIAEAREDIALANNYKLSYNMLLSRARQERYEKDGKYPVTKTVRRGRRR